MADWSRRGFGGAVAALMLALAAIGSAAAPASAQKAAQPVRVFAAASLTDALNELADAYAKAGHVKPVLNYAGSSVLARQIEQGARADVFISADEPWMDYLAERKLIDPATRSSFLSNRLVLIAPADKPFVAKIASGFDLAKALGGGKLAMADPDSVPAGRYGRAALQSLGAWDRVQGAVVRAENVREALRLVETGEAAAGIVYRTDALAAGARVRIVAEFPETSHPKISYPAAAIAEGSGPEAAAFLTFLKSAPAGAVFRRFGFILLQ